MEVVHHRNGITFTWDSEKAMSNTRKHGVTFETACEIFFDPFIRLLSSEVVGGDERDRGIGMTASWKLLVVVHHIREDAVRIISARPATSQERLSYENEPAT
jgi:uncharacterized DUF497 family protein